MEDFRKQAQTLHEEMVARRRDLHRHPETAFEEVRTSGLVAQELTALGLEVQTGVGKTGVVGVLEGAEDGPTVLLRCDMDALPIHEENDVEYRSQVDGKMHACGHDGHVTIGLAVAKLLNAQRDRLKGRVKFIFQPAEEIGQGAMAMINDGVMVNPAPEVSFGLHLWPEFPAGHVAIAPGPVMSGGSFFDIMLTGEGGHAAYPHRTIDPLVATAQMVTALQTITSRNLDPLEDAVLSVTQIQGGHAFNVIPNQALLRGTFRTFNTSIRDRITERIEQIVHNIATAMNCKVEMTIDHLVPPVVNDAAVAKRLLDAYPQVVPGLTYQAEYRTIVSEDAAFYLERTPGLYFFIGSGIEGRKLPLHHPQYDIDEDALVMGASVIASAVSDYVL